MARGASCCGFQDESCLWGGKKDSLDLVTGLTVPMHPVSASVSQGRLNCNNVRGLDIRSRWLPASRSLRILGLGSFGVRRGWLDFGFGPLGARIDFKFGRTSGFENTTSDTRSCAES